MNNKAAYLEFPFLVVTLQLAFKGKLTFRFLEFPFLVVTLQLNNLINNLIKKKSFHSS